MLERFVLIFLSPARLPGLNPCKQLYLQWNLTFHPDVRHLLSPPGLALLHLPTWWWILFNVRQAVSGLSWYHMLWWNQFSISFYDLQTSPALPALTGWHHFDRNFSSQFTLRKWESSENIKHLCSDPLKNHFFICYLQRKGEELKNRNI